MLKIKNDPRQTIEPLNKAMKKVQDYINENIVGKSVMISNNNTSLISNSTYHNFGGSFIVKDSDLGGKTTSYTLNAPISLNNMTVTPSITVGEDGIEMSYTVSEDKLGNFSGGSVELNLDDINTYVINGTETSTGLVNETKLKTGSIETRDVATSAERAVTNVAAAGTILIGTVIIAGCVLDNAAGVVLDDAAIPPTLAAIKSAAEQLQASTPLLTQQGA